MLIAVRDRCKYIHRLQSRLLFPQHPHHHILRMLHGCLCGIDIQPADARCSRLWANHSSQGAVCQQTAYGHHHSGDHAVCGNNLVIDYLFRLIDLPFQIAAIGRAFHIVVNDLLLFCYLALMENTGFVMMDGINEIAEPESVEPCANPFRVLRRDRLRVEKFVAPGIINSCVVHHNHRHSQHCFAHLKDKERRCMLRHQRYLRSIIVKIIQTKKGG